MLGRRGPTGGFGVCVLCGLWGPQPVRLPEAIPQAFHGWLLTKTILPATKRGCHKKLELSIAMFIPSVGVYSSPARHWAVSTAGNTALPSASWGETTTGQCSKGHWWADLTSSTAGTQLVGVSWRLPQKSLWTLFSRQQFSSSPGASVGCWAGAIRRLHRAGCPGRGTQASGVDSACGLAAQLSAGAAMGPLPVPGLLIAQMFPKGTSQGQALQEARVGSFRLAHGPIQTAARMSYWAGLVRAAVGSSPSPCGTTTPAKSHVRMGEGKVPLQKRTRDGRRWRYSQLWKTECIAGSQKALVSEWHLLQGPLLA